MMAASSVRSRQSVCHRGSAGCRQSGWALAMVTLVALWQASADVALVRDAGAQATGHWLLQMRLAADQMLKAHYDVLSARDMPREVVGQPAFARPLAPMLVELARAGHLPADFSVVSTLGFTADVSIAVAPSCLGVGCRLDAAVNRYPDRRPGRLAGQFGRAGCHQPDARGLCLAGPGRSSSPMERQPADPARS